MPKGDPLVSIRCTVYNHEPYLRQCLDGFVMQQTTFPFEAIVHDDASTDNSAAIIREYAERYPEIIKPIYETENQYSKHDGSLARIMDAAMHPNSKYVAICEGDDYWTDPDKLQHQVDIMESDSNIGLVHTLAKVYIQKENRFLEKLWGQPINSFEDELVANRPVTLTTCFRRDLYYSYRGFLVTQCPNNWMMGDYPMWLYMSYYSKSFFIEKSTGVYRILENSASHNPDAQKLADFEISAFNVRVFFAEQFHHEHMLKDMATNLVKKMQNLSISYMKTIDYDFWGIYQKYNINKSKSFIIKHYVLRNSLSRSCYYLCLWIISRF